MIEMIRVNWIKFWVLWVFANSLTLGSSFGLATGLQIRLANHPNPSIGLSLPFNHLASMVFISLCLGLVQLVWMRKFQWGDLPKYWMPTWWILSFIVGLNTILAIRYAVFLGDMFVNPNAPTTTESESVIGAQSGAIGGFWGGALIGLFQSCFTPIHQWWIVVNAIAWSAGWGLGWIVMTYFSTAPYSETL
jgi:hypothetical protein